jgi:hypothetical protein
MSRYIIEMSSIPPYLPPTPSGLSTTTTHIATLDELLASHGAQVAKETADTATLQQLSSVNSENLRAALFSWAAAGFPNIYVVISIPLVLPAACSDGVVRNTYDYIEWLTDAKIPNMIAAIQTRLTDIEASYSISGTTFRVHVTRTK